jgi:hypothetical protein
MLRRSTITGLFRAAPRLFNALYLRGGVSRKCHR